MILKSWSIFFKGEKSMARITFERSINRDIIAYDVMGVDERGKVTKIKRVKKTESINPIKVALTLSSQDMIASTISETRYSIKFNKILRAHDIAVEYKGELINANNVRYNEEDNTLSILEQLPKESELTVILYIDGIEVTIDSEKYITYLVKPVINAQNTLLGYHSKLV